MRYLLNQQSQGEYHKLKQGISESYDLLILGNSRAERQFIPSILEEKSGLKTFNLGFGGRDLLFVKALQELVVRAPKPKALMVEIQYFTMRSKIKYDRMAFLNPLYHEHAELRPHLHRNEFGRRLAFHSSFYQFNSSLWDVIMPYFREEPSYDGYRPLFGSLKASQVASGENKFIASEQNEMEMENLLQDLVSDLEIAEIPLILVLSPQFKELQQDFTAERAFFKSLTSDQVQVWDYSQDPDFMQKAELYHDIRHLNDSGAQMFSEKLADRINTDLLPILSRD